MNKIIALFALLVITLNVTAQDLAEKDILGSWKVKEVTQQPDNPDYAPIVEGFSKATFTFNESGDFQFSSSSESAMFSQISNMFQNIKWKYELEKQYLKMGSEADHFSILTMYVKKIDDVMHFHLNESGIKFIMIAAE